MPWFVALWSTFVAILPQLLTRIGIAAGIGVVAYQGVHALLDEALDLVQVYVGQLPPLALQLVTLCRVDDAITVIFSAYIVRLTFMGMTASGVMKKVLWRPGQQGDLFN